MQTTINVPDNVSEGGHNNDMITDRRDVMPGRMEGEENEPRWEGRRGGWNTIPLLHSGITRLKLR